MSVEPHPAHSAGPAGGHAAGESEVSAQVTAGTITTGAAGKVSVNVLGRYNFDRDLIPGRRPANLDVTFRTVHGSKGLEADYIVLPNLTTGTYGFPSDIADDPVLALAMPAPDTFEHAEERRLFYVALTRARREVVLISPTQRISPFVTELLARPGNPNVVIGGANEVPVEVCPQCRKGILVQRKGPHGLFLGCSTFPACRHTRSLGSGPAARRPGTDSQLRQSGREASRPPF